jgi:ribosomal protein S18 acetylase RimI-like enzyme
MKLPDGYHELEPGRLAAVVTYLEMRAKPAFPSGAAADGYDIVRVERPDLGWYRALFRAIGEQWLWFSRLALSDAELEKELWAPGVEVYSLVAGEKQCGLLELAFRGASEGELTFLGVTPALTGKGVGAALLRKGIERGWESRPSRFWLHTCSLDHHAALGFYVRHGFTPYKRAIEIAPDPRLTGILRRDAAAQVPLIER